MESRRSGRRANRGGVEGQADRAGVDGVGAEHCVTLSGGGADKLGSAEAARAGIMPHGHRRTPRVTSWSRKGAAGPTALSFLGSPWAETV